MTRRPPRIERLTAQLTRGAAPQVEVSTMLHQPSKSSLGRVIGLCFSLFAYAGAARAQTPYTVTYSLGTYTELTSGGATYEPVAYGALLPWDEGAAAIPLPFTFTWFGERFDTLYAYTNGLVAFDPPPAQGGVLSPPAVVPNTQGRIHDFIAPVWADLIGGTAPEIRAITRGGAGSRVFTVQVRGLRTFSNASSAVAFQVRLHEADNSVEIIYGPNNGIGQVGTSAIENADGTIGMNLHASTAQCTGACVCAPASCGSVNWQPAGETITLRLPSGPELAGGISGPPGAYPGDRFDVQVRLRNFGLTRAPAFDYEIRLAPTRTGTAGSTLLERARASSGLAPATTFEVTRTVTMPQAVAPGTYFLAVVVDAGDEVAEVIETNDVAFARTGIATAPDLSGEITGPTRSGPGEPIAVTVALESRGAPVRSPVNVALLLSRDAIPDDGDFALGSVLVALPDGFSGSATTNVAIPASAPLSPPAHQVLAVIDDQASVAETDETNNVAVLAPLTLDGPDLMVPGVDGGPFAFRGVVYPVTTSIRNAGGATARDFVVCVLLSRNEHVSVLTDPILFESPRVTLAPGQEEQFTLSPVVPTQTGTGAWFLATVVDCDATIAESSETNNIERRPDPIAVRDPVPDLLPVEISAPPRGTAGETVPVAARIGNLGPVEGVARVRFVLSTNAGVTASDRVLFEPAEPVRVAAQAEATVTGWAQLPAELDSGAYTIGVVVDPDGQVEEVREDNNALGMPGVLVDGVGLAIVSPPPPPAVIGVPYVRRFSAVGGDGAYTWTLTFDSGAAPAGLSFDAASAELRGTPEPAAEGRHALTVRVTSGSLSRTEHYALIVASRALPLTLVSSRLPAALAQESYSVRLSAVGGRPPYAWALVDTAPPGIGVSPEGTLGGEPQNPGAYTFRVAVTDAAGARVEGLLSLDIVDPRVGVAIGMADIPSAVIGEAYTFHFDVSGGRLPYTWRFESEPAIPGIAFDTLSATLTGTPTHAGEYPFVVEVRDASGLFDRNAYVLEVDAPGNLRIVTPQSGEGRLPEGKLGEPYVGADGNAPRLTAVLRSGGEPGALTWTLVDGALPAGLALEPVSGAVSGTPSEAGDFAFRVLVTDATGDFAFAALVISVASSTSGDGRGDGCGCAAVHRSGVATGSSLAILGLAVALMLRVRSSSRERARRHRARGASLLAWVVGVLGAPSAASAQLYVATESPAPFVPLAGGTPVPFTGGQDDGVALIPIGFAFAHYGRTYAYANVSVNGVLTLAAACGASASCPGASETCSASGFCAASSIRWDPAHGIPSTDSPNAVIAAFWDDLYVATQAPATVIRYATLGTAPNRELVVEWLNVRHYRSSLSSASFQIQLREAGGLRIQYGPYLSNPADDASWTGLIGIENADGSEGVAPLPCATGSSTCGSADLTALANHAIDFVVPNQPELVASVDAPTGALPGDPVSIAVEVRNIGPVATPAGVTVRAYLSADDVITPADTPLGSVTLPPIEASGVASVNLSGRVDAATAIGRYRVGALVDPDDVIAEAIETNNAAVAPRSFLAGADVAVTIGAIPTIGTNEPIDVPIHILNLGAALPSVSYALYLSSDTELDAGDVELARGATPLAAIDDTLVHVLTAVPDSVAPGAYHPIVRVDPDEALVEIDEDNNVAVAPVVTEISGPDLVAVQVEGDALLFAGEPYVMRSTLRNAGAGAARRFSYGLYASTNAVVTITDPLLAEVGPIDLAPGETRAFVDVVTIPQSLPRGPIYLGLIADNETSVAETVETNNVYVDRQPVTLRAPAPDFAVVDVVLPREAAAGESFPVERTLANLGNVGGTVEYAVYLSVDPLIDPTTDLELGRGSVALAARGEDRGLDRLRIPADVVRGPYYVGYVVDGAAQVEELHEDNNLRVADTSLEVLPGVLTVLTRAIPSPTVHVPFEFILAAAGGSGRYRWQVESGALPDGLDLDGDAGRIFGTATVEGRSTVTFSVSDGALRRSAAFEITVAEVSLPLAVATPVLAPGFVGRAYRYPLTGFGGAPPYTWTTDRRLPDGLALSPDGLLSGTPSAPALAAINFEVTDALGTRAERPLVLRVINGDASVRFSAEVLPEGAIGEAYDQELRVAPGTGESPFAFSISGGSLPPGLELSDGHVVGVPKAMGTFPVEVRVSDARGDFDRNLFLITIREVLGVAITTMGLPGGRVGAPYLGEGGAVVSIRGFSSGRPEAVLTYSLYGDGVLPPGLTLEPDGTLHGVPTAEGAFTFLVVARDDVGQRDLRALAILVEGAPEAEPAARVPAEEGCGCRAAGRGSGPELGVFAVLGLLFFFRSFVGRGVGRYHGRAHVLGLLFFFLSFVRRRRAFGGRAGCGLALVLLAVSAETEARAQVGVAYRVTTRTEPYLARAGTPVVFRSNDDALASVTLPFEFHFFGETYGEVQVGTNGLVAFGGNATLPATNVRIPSAGAPNGFIAGAWDDLIANDVSTLLEGHAPERTFIIQYTGVRPYIGSGSLSFQIRLFEGPGGAVEVHYGPMTAVVASEWRVTTGVESPRGDVGAYFLPCADACSGADLAAAENSVYRAQADAGLDLVPSALEVPEVLYPGVPFSARASITSLHDGPIGPFRYELQLVDPVRASQARAIFTSEPVTLAAFETMSARADVSVPEDVAEGRYRVRLVVDSTGAVDEPDEANNALFADGTVRVEGPKPNFRAGDVATSTLAAAPGGVLGVTAHLENAGNLAGHAAYSIRLSPNAIVSADDLEIGSGAVDLAPSEARALDLETVLPESLPPGAYYVGLLVDARDEVRELSELDNVAASARPVVITSGRLAVMTLALPRGHVGVPYSTYLRASGGDGRYTWRMTSGTLPDGLNLVPSTGELRGSPRSAGAPRVTLEVESGGARAAVDLTLEIAVVDPGLTIVTRELLPAIVGDAYPPAPLGGVEDEALQRIQTTGASGAVTFLALGKLPAGLSLNRDGLLHGTPTARGVYEIRVRATDGTQTAERTLLLTIAEPGRLALVSAVLYPVIGEEFVYSLHAVGQARTATLSFVTEDELPRGMSLTEDGYLGGVPSRVESRTVAVTVFEGPRGDPLVPRDTAVVMISVVSDGALRVTPSSLPDGIVGMEYSARLSAAGGEGALAWRVRGALPEGIEWVVERRGDVDTLVFHGTPTAEAFTPIEVDVEDEIGRSFVAALAIHITGAEAIDGPAKEGGCACVSSARPPSVGVSISLMLIALLLGFRRRSSFLRTELRLVTVGLLAACASACGGDSVDPPGATLSSIQRDVFSQSCTFSSCHDSSGAGNGLILEPPAHARLVGKAATGVPSRMLVIPGDPDRSYLLEKLERDAPSSGLRMPEGSPKLPAAQLAAIREWISAGAEDN